MSSDRVRVSFYGDELLRIERRAAHCGMSVPQFIRAAALFRGFTPRKTGRGSTRS